MNYFPNSQECVEEYADDFGVPVVKEGRKYHFCAVFSVLLLIIGNKWLNLQAKESEDAIYAEYQGTTDGLE
jgi:hypothetical protein